MAGGCFDFAEGGDEFAAVLFDLRGDGQRRTDEGGFLESCREFGADAEAFTGPGGGPDHGFIEDGGDDSAVDDSFEADVIFCGGKCGGDDSGGGIDVEGEVEAVGIVLAADEAIGRVG